MKIYYGSQKMKDCCDHSKLAQRRWGPENADKLQLRLTLLSKEPKLSGIPIDPPPACHPLHGDCEGQFAVSLKFPARLIFVPANDPIPRKLDGGIDLERVTEIKILEITDYHRGHY